MSGVIDTLNKEIIEFNAGDTVKVTTKSLKEINQEFNHLKVLLFQKKVLALLKLLQLEESVLTISVLKEFSLYTHQISTRLKLFLTEK